MRSIKELFEKSDLIKFKEKCGSFFEGSDGLLEKHGLKCFSHDYSSTEMEEKLTDFINKIDNRETLIMFKNYLELNIDRKREQLSQLKQDVIDMEKEISDKTKTVELTTKSKSFKAFFKKIIKD